MAYTKTLIAKLAMGHLGDRDIADIDDQFDLDAQILKARYDHARDLVYTAHDWKWAKRSAQLQQKVTPPVVRYTYAYALPNDFARISNISEFDDMRIPLDESGWDISGGELTTDVGYVFVDYVSNNWSEAVWPAHFAACVAEMLAEISCLKITHNEGLKKMLGDHYAKVTLPQGRSIDSTSQPARKTIITSNWQKARLGSRSFNNLRRL